MLTDTEIQQMVTAKYKKEPYSKEKYAKIDAEVAEMKSLRDEKLNRKFHQENLVNPVPNN